MPYLLRSETNTCLESTCMGPLEGFYIAHSRGHFSAHSTQQRPFYCIQHIAAGGNFAYHIAPNFLQIAHSTPQQHHQFANKYTCVCELSLHYSNIRVLPNKFFHKIYVHRRQLPVYQAQMSQARLSACMLIFHRGHNNTIQVYSVTVMTHVKALQAGQSSQGTSEPITPVLVIISPNALLCDIIVLASPQPRSTLVNPEGHEYYMYMDTPQGLARFQAKLVLGQAAANVKIRGSRCLPMRA